MEQRDMIVEFDKYCNTCEYKDTLEFREPCQECLSNPTRPYSVKPLKYKKEEKKEKKK